ncbi:hypothetical protein [Pseudohongiella spirulinae]|uniref:hypothetical protein n=1 Tax=Pseudohongiella spirulinae TaxID=1249552 RepID=UPI003AAAD124
MGTMTGVTGGVLRDVVTAPHSFDITTRDLCLSSDRGSGLLPIDAGHWCTSNLRFCRRCYGCGGIAIGGIALEPQFTNLSIRARQYRQGVFHAVHSGGACTGRIYASKSQPCFFRRGAIGNYCRLRERGYAEFFCGTGQSHERGGFTPWH